MDGAIEVTEASPEQVAAWEQALAPLVAAKLAEVAETGVDAEAALAFFKAEIEKASE